MRFIKVVITSIISFSIITDSVKTEKDFVFDHNGVFKHYTAPLNVNLYDKTKPARNKINLFVTTRIMCEYICTLSSGRHAANIMCYYCRQRPKKTNKNDINM